MADKEKARAKFAEDVAKLLVETERLRKDVQLLYGRIIPFDGEEPLLGDVNLGLEKIRTPSDLISAIAGSRRRIMDCEYHLSAIRGRMDEIASDAYLRDELKPYIIPPRPKGGRTSD